MERVRLIRVPAIIFFCAALVLAAGFILAQDEVPSGNASTTGTSLQPPTNLRITASPRPAEKPLDRDGHLMISEGDRCPVCAMRPVRVPHFASALRLKNGTTYYCCGPGCLIKSWMHPEIYLGVPKTELDLPVVREYFTGKPMDAREVTWVSGSDVIGPMGPTIIPVSGEAEMEAFKRRHGGKVLFTLGEMTDARWQEITGKPMVQKD